MMRILHHLNALPRGLRWAVFLPVGIVSTLIVEGVLAAVFDAAGVPRALASTGGMSRAAMLAFMWALMLTLVPAVLSPRPWAVGVVMFAVGLVIRVAPVISAMMVPYQRARLPPLAVGIAVMIGGHVLGGGVGLYLIRVLAARTNDHEWPQASS